MGLGGGDQGVGLGGGARGWESLWGAVGGGQEPLGGRGRGARASGGQGEGGKSLWGAGGGGQEPLGGRGRGARASGGQGEGGKSIWGAGGGEAWILTYVHSLAYPQGEANCILAGLVLNFQSLV